MRTKIVIASLLIILAILNYSIYEKERIKQHGEILLLELAPADPRSLMQGDYMRLRYVIEEEAPARKTNTYHGRGYMVIRPDEERVAQFVRFHNDINLTSDERLLHFHNHYRRVRVVPNSFFFQEGHAKYYEDARYGVFKFNNSSDYLLVGLADENKNIIYPL